MKKAELVVAIALAGVAIWLHVARAMNAGGLWRDEAGAAQVALRPSVQEMAEVFQHEAFPLLFPLTVRTYAAVAGTSDAAFRVFGLLVGLGLIALLWLNARTVSRDLPVLSLALVGINSLVLQWGDSIRGYGLGTLLVCHLRVDLESRGFALDCDGGRRVARCDF